MSRVIDIRISAAAERGFCIYEAGEIVAAFTSRAEVAEWIETRLGEVDGEIDRERQDMADTIENFPNVVSRTDPKGWRWRRRG